MISFTCDIKANPVHITAFSYSIFLGGMLLYIAVFSLTLKKINSFQYIYYLIRNTGYVYTINIFVGFGSVFGCIVALSYHNRYYSDLLYITTIINLVLCPCVMSLICSKTLITMNRLTQRIVELHNPSYIDILEYNRGFFLASVPLIGIIIIYIIASTMLQ
jgi:hypothetical protein